MPKWTEQQNNAINARDCSVIVSAAAGSGKTAVLTERLASMIADPSSGVRADRIIAVTFTNDAAAELKKRLDSKLIKLITENPSDRHLIKQQVLLQSARISTINAFCFELLREHITDEGITSGFSVLDEADNTILKAQALDDTLNYFSENDYDKIAYLYDKFCMSDDQNLSSVINLVDRFLSSVTMRNLWIENTLAEFQKPFEESVYFQNCIDAALKTLKKALSLSENCCELIDDIYLSDCKSQDNLRIQADEERQKIISAIKIFESGKLPEPAQTDSFTSFDSLIKTSKNDEIDTQAREKYKSKRKTYVALVRSAMKSFDGAKEDFLENGEVFSVLSEFLIKYDKLVWEKKCSRNSISFDDGERLVLEILADKDENGNIVPSETAESISEYYDIIMVDEYQDSNNKEDMIFKLISKEPQLNENGKLLHGKNVFLVGDVKQSIYKFRLANPKNFIATLANSVPYTPDDCNPVNTSIALNKNFRSSEQVIDYVNFLFTQIMSPQCGDIAYTSDEMLYFGAVEEYSGASQEETITHISLVKTDADEDSSEKQPAANNIEGAHTADMISNMINSGYKVKTKNGERPCEPSDFCILVRTNAFSKAYIDELRARGINAKGEDEKGYLKSREISILIDVLRVINNPLLEVSVAAIMLSPMYMFNIEEVAYIKSLDKEKHLFTLLSSIADGEYSEYIDAFLAERCRDFLESIEKFRLASITITISELIDKIYDTTDFISVMQLRSDGESKRANLRALIQYAKSYEEAVAFEGSGGLSGFIRYIDRIIESGNDLTQGKTSSSSGNYVKVQTIHKSKGLEYPFVFLVENTRKFRYDTLQAMCADDCRIGFILNNPELVRRRKTVSLKHICEENKVDVISEEMRLLYVALTRAKQKLFINLKVNEKQLKRVKKLLEIRAMSVTSTSEAAEYANSYSDWIWMSLFEHNDFSDIAAKIFPDNEELMLPDICFDKPLFTVEDEESSALTTESLADETADKALPDDEMIENLKKIINLEYDSSLSQLPAKLSVTQITQKFKGEEKSFDFKLKRPKFMSESNILTGTERGTAIHTFFQYCDFSLAQSSPEAEIDRMCELGYISAQQAKSISVENVSAFFRSELYDRILKADNIWREKKFMVAVSELDIHNELMEKLNKSDGMIKGIIDLLIAENGRLIIVDYKSDRNTSENSLKERYKVQLQLYKSAIELTTGMCVSGGYLYSFELKKTIPIEI